MTSRGNLGSYVGAFIGTQEYALDERALSHCTHEFRQTYAIGASPRNINALVLCTSFNRCEIRGMSSSRKCVINNKDFSRRPSSGLMHKAEMREMLIPSSSSYGVVTGTFGRREVEERGLTLFT
jgi:hypothetical protein